MPQNLKSLLKSCRQLSRKGLCKELLSILTDEVLEQFRNEHLIVAKAKALSKTDKAGEAVILLKLALNKNPK